LQTEGTKEEMDDGGDELTMYLVLSWIWEICLPAYTLYMAYSYYMEIDRGQRIGLMYGRLTPSRLSLIPDGIALCSASSAHVPIQIQRAISRLTERSFGRWQVSGYAGLSRP